MTTMQYLALCIVLFSFIAGNAAAQRADGVEIQLTDNKSDQYLPVIHGNWILWEDQRNVDPALDIENATLKDQAEADIDVYAYNITSGEVGWITEDARAQGEPAVYNEYAVWTDLRNVNLSTSEDNITIEQLDTDIFGFNLSTGEERLLTENFSLASAPDIYENIVVWEDSRNGNSDIYIYDLSTSEEFRLTADESNQTNPAIYGDRIVWEDDRDGNWNIYMYDLYAGEEVPIVTNESDQINPAIYGDIIVWEDYGNTNISVEDAANMTQEEKSQQDVDIYMYDLTSGQEMLVTDNTSWQGQPDIYGNIIVWTDLRNGNQDIFMYDLSAGEEFHVTENEADQTDPRIYENMIVWTDYRNGNGDVYMYDLSSEGTGQDIAG